jgi:Domain of unknown function (DUF4166)
MSAIARERTRPAGEETRAPADHRLQVLLGANAWARLPVQVQQRFSKPLGAGATRLYRGRVVETRLSLSGRILGQIARLIGAPLPLQNNAVGPSTVSVVEDAGVGGQVWTRVYPQPGRFPQVVHSAKRFRGPTGLEEYIGCGIGMELTVAVETGRLVFRSRRYFLEWGRTRLVLPGWLGPGAMEIVHAQDDAAEFSFTLTVHHPWLGELVRQQALYQDA